MGALKTTRADESNKMMLGFIVRRCAAELGHPPTPDEFARWANAQKQNGKTYCLFGKEISTSVAKLMFSQPGRMVTVSPEGLQRIWTSSRRQTSLRTQGKAIANMDQVIIQSITKKRRLRFTYNGKTRLVEPQCYGIGTTGTELLRVHQIDGGSQREPLFDVAKMTDVVLLDEAFTKPGPNYTKNDSAMKTIFCQL